MFTLWWLAELYHTKPLGRQLGMVSNLVNLLSNIYRRYYYNTEPVLSTLEVKARSQKVTNILKRQIASWSTLAI